MEMGNVSVTSEVTSGMEVGICDLATVAGSAARHLIFSLGFQLL